MYKVSTMISLWDDTYLLITKMAEEYSNLTNILSRLVENEEYTRDIITNIDSFFLTINGSLIILMQVNLVMCFFFLLSCWSVIFLGRIWFYWSRISQKQKCYKHPHQKLCRLMLWWQNNLAASEKNAILSLSTKSLN